MPTFNQLVKQGRKQATYKSNSPAMQKGLNTLKNKETDLASPMAMRSPLTSPASGIPCRSTLWS